MALGILCRDSPHRSIALVTEDDALILQHAPYAVNPAISNLNPSCPKCVVKFCKLSSIELSTYRLLGRGHGTIGFITLDCDVFICIVTAASEVASPRPGETVKRIDAVEFFCLNRSDYDTELGFNNGNPELYEDNDPGAGYGNQEIPYQALKKLLMDGSFYYSVDFDLTNRLQVRCDEEAVFDIQSLNRNFLWNSYMISPLLQFRSHLTKFKKRRLDLSRILTSVIRGFVKTLTIPAAPSLTNVESNLPLKLTIISRLSSQRVGTRFNSRGIDDTGNVSNFVETETLLWIPNGLYFSYAQVRGSVPIFWEQVASTIPTQQKIHVTRSVDATQPAFDKHFWKLLLDYGSIHIVNLLSETKQSEIEISDRYRCHVSRSVSNSEKTLGPLRETEFDFHAETRGPAGYQSASIIEQFLTRSAQEFDFFLLKDMPRQRYIVHHQKGAFRTNCLDCLDRTNLIQTIISRLVLDLFLSQQESFPSPGFWMRHASLWADNGDALSKSYAGTGALKSSFTRHGRMSFAGAVADARKSATRFVINNFSDKARQKTIELLLGSLTNQQNVQLFDPINDAVNSELEGRAEEYLSYRNIKIWVGTLNLNGLQDGAREDLSSWVLPHWPKIEEEPSVVAVGFQEIVELSPQQIMSTDPSSRKVWEDSVSNILNLNRPRSAGKYVLLRSGQLVGTALLLFVKEELLSSIKNVEGNTKKTGLSGIAGNKGGCAIRMELYNTRFCFVTAHLAAGFANYDERNRDYATISHGLLFQKDCGIDDHDVVIWFGDFNYRIGLTNESAKKLIDAGDLDTLYSNDQLNLQMIAGLVFPFYSEGRICFPPTYKYDIGKDVYDTSEKARIPAWCDRVLWKGSNIRQLQYYTAPLRFSDHRPVYARLECTISIVNEAIKENLRKEIYMHQKGIFSKAYTDSSDSDIVEKDDYAGDCDSLHNGLPYPSSAHQRWWLGPGFPATSTVRVQSGYLPHPGRRPNPFSPELGPDWIHVSKVT